MVRLPVELPTGVTHLLLLHWLYSPYGPWPIFQFRNLYTIGSTLGRGISPSHGRYLQTEQHKQNKRTQISMPRVGIEPTSLAFERAKTFQALDRAATVIGTLIT
jgi:hypothetical protein